MIQLDASIIIPTYNRSASLQRTLESLTQQNMGELSFEVIVVDDGSTDGTSDVCRRTFSYPLKYHCQTNQGSAAARNAGAQLASGRLLIFFDDDMLAEQEYVVGLLEEHGRYSRIIGMGRELPFLPENASTYAEIVTTLPNSLDEQGGVIDFTACVTNNLSIYRDDFFELGGMQDVAGDGPTWWGDVDFGYRAYLKGFQFHRSERAVCSHCDYSTADLVTSSTRAEKVSYMVHHLIRKYPGIEQYLPMFADKSPIDWHNDHIAMKFRKAIRLLTSTSLVVGGLEAAVRQLERHYPKPALLAPLYRWTVGGYIYRGYRRGLEEVRGYSAPVAPAPAKNE